MFLGADNYSLAMHNRIHEYLYDSLAHVPANLLPTDSAPNLLASISSRETFCCRRLSRVFIFSRGFSRYLVRQESRRYCNSRLLRGAMLRISYLASRNRMFQPIGVPANETFDIRPPPADGIDASKRALCTRGR